MRCGKADHGAGRSRKIAFPDGEEDRVSISEPESMKPSLYTSR